MNKISGDYDRAPLWLNVNRQMVPDFIAKDPKASPVWEITGAEFSKAELHTAAGISIRFVTPHCCWQLGHFHVFRCPIRSMGHLYISRSVSVFLVT